MTNRVLVTAALPYANGSIHLGHLVEYCQADIYVRALKAMGEDALYICANDAHGTPIELNARGLGIEPEALVQRFYEEHQRDFARFDISFDHYSITHSEANRAIVESAYYTLRDKGLLEDREVDGIWCPYDERFLPDRFIRGTCPACGAEDQYGDVCETCGATYTTADVLNPRCALCGNTPVSKKSTHVYFKLSAPEQVAFLRRWIDGGALQPDVANFVRHWLDSGLQDWCISRDGPYFGFPIPDRPGKYFYVWLDAPFGYVSASWEWGQEHEVPFDALWRSEQTRIEHFIGKDIVYFHTLFWPAVLNAIGYSLPAHVFVHGMLTVNGEKMSKSRGTFINAATFAEHIDPQALRYFYACKYGTGSEDLDLSFDDFLTRVNGELVNKHANLFSRASRFLTQKLDGRLGELPFAADMVQTPPSGDGSVLDLARQVVTRCRSAEQLYRQREFAQVARELTAIADIGNEYMQAQKPWEQLKSDPAAARETCTFALNVCYALAVYLWPIVPRFAEAGAQLLGTDLGRMDVTTLFRERNRPLGEPNRLFERIQPKTIERLVEAAKQPNAGKAQPETKNTAQQATAPSTPTIDIDTFAQMELRVGRVVRAEPIAKSDKLLRVEVDLGEPTVRQVVAGLAKAYAPSELEGTKVIVVANLAPAKIMGVPSQGMILAGGQGESLGVLRPDRDLAVGERVR